MKGLSWAGGVGLGRTLYSKSKSFGIVVSLGKLPNCLLVETHVSGDGACEVRCLAYGGEILCICLHLVNRSEHSE